MSSTENSRHLPGVKSSLSPSEENTLSFCSYRGNSVDYQWEFEDVTTRRLLLRPGMHQKRYLHISGATGWEKIVIHANAETGSTMHLEVGRRVKVLVTN